MFEWLTDPNAWVALGTLTALEIVLGIDNIVFISILTGRLPEEQQAKGRTIGLLLAMGMRILLLFSIAWVMGLTATLFSLPLLEGEMAVITGRDLILFAGGLFLIWKSTHEIHDKLEGVSEEERPTEKTARLLSVLVQIAMLDLVFSLDSVITAVGMAEDLAVMVIAIVIAVGMMMVFAGPVSRFVRKHPTVKMLALAFLILIGVTLVAESLAQHIPKGYIYSAMAFSLLVEMLNLRASSQRKGTEPVELYDSPYITQEGAAVHASKQKRPVVITRPDA